MGARSSTSCAGIERFRPPKVKPCPLLEDPDLSDQCLPRQRGIRQERKTLRRRLAARDRAQDDGSANSDLALATTLLGVGYHRRLVSISFSPSIDTLNSPRPPLTVFTST